MGNTAQPTTKPVGILQTPVKNLARSYFNWTGFTPGAWPKFMPTGLLPGAITQGLAGTLLGAYAVAPVVSRLFPQIQPRRARNVFGVLGAAAGALPVLPFLLTAYQKWGTKGLFNQPQQQTKSSSTWRKQASLPSPDMSPIGIASTRASILADPHMDVVEKTRALGYLDNAAAGRNSGLLSNPGQRLFGAMVGAGLGYGTAALGGKVMGAVYGMQPSTQSTLRRVGLVAGLLRGAGII